MFIIFCIAQVIAGFFMLIFGAALIESPDTVTMLLGCMFALIGILVAVMFTLLIDKKLKGEIF